jgi:hypothetical protein
MDKQAFLPPLAAMAAPLMMAPVYGASSAISGLVSSRARSKADKLLERLLPSSDPAVLKARQYGGIGGIGAGALGGTLLGTAIGDEFGSPIPGAMIGGLAGTAAGYSGGQTLGEHGLKFHKYMQKMYPNMAPYATGALAGTTLGGALGHALLDDSPYAGTIGGALLGGGLGAIANSALARKGKFAGLIDAIRKSGLHKKSSAIMLPALSGGLGAAGLAGGFGFGNFDLSTKDVIVRRMLPALIAGALGGGVLGHVLKGDKNGSVQEQD